MSVTISKKDNSSALIEWIYDPSEPINQNPLILLDNLYALHPDGYLFDPRYINRRYTKYDGKVHLFKIYTNTIPLGLAKEIIPILRQYNWKVQYTQDIVTSFRDNTDYSPFMRSFTQAIVNATGMTPRDYQEKILELALKNKRCCFRAATGAGKSLAIYMIVRFFLKKFGDDQKFLILVPNKGLVNQLHQNFRDDYKWTNVDEHVGMYHSEFSEKERRNALTKKVMISTWQSMGSLLKKKTAEQFFKTFTTLIVDELHTAKKEMSMINDVVRACTSAEYRFGLTGTIPRNVLDVKTLMGNFGDVHQIISSRELIERGELSKATIYEVRIPYDEYSVNLCKKSKIKIDEERELIRLSGSTQAAISQLINTNMIQKDENTLILVKQIQNGEHGDMVDYLKKNHPEFEIESIHGKIDMEDREEIRLGIENRKGVIIVATYKTFGTGVNMKNLHNVIFASSTTSYTSILQSIGRSLRLHSSKNTAKVFDINHYLHLEYISKITKEQKIYNSHIAKHYLSREEFYYEEEYPLEVISVDHVGSFKNIDINHIEVTDEDAD